MRTAVRRFAVSVAILASLCMWSSPVRAAENESFGISAQPERVNGVDRTSFEIPLETGATYQDAVKVFNKTDQPIDLRMYAADATGSGPSNITVGFDNEHPKGVGAWIHLSRTKFSLAPHGQANVPFTVDVKNSNPEPNIGAIVVENTATGLSADLAERLDVLVRTAPPNTPTTSIRVRPYLLRSPWVIVAIAGLVIVIILVVIGWRRSRRTRDAVVPAGAVEGADHLQAIPAASLPVIRRLGASSDDEDEDDPDEPPLLDDDLLVEVDEPLFIDDGDDVFEDEDEEEEDLPPARSRPSAPKRAPVKASARKPAPRKAAAKRKPAATKQKPRAPRTTKPKETGFIPLDDL